jgi:glycosyltransferase involved in cell wall biosynthesis
MVIISNGFNKFHLAVAAAEAQQRGLLSCFITGAYPTTIVRRFLRQSFVSKVPKLARLTARGEAIEDRLIRSLWLAETVYNIAIMFRNIAPSAAERIDMKALKMYGKRAAPHVVEAARSGARIYHYRAGFGCESVKAAKSTKMITLCDYSLAHAALLSALIADGGRLPLAGTISSSGPLWSQVLQDALQADIILANSDFVRETFLHQGWNPDRIRVLYWGVDDAFLKEVPSRTLQRVQSDPLRLLFAGGFERRKGAELVIAALKLCDDLSWTLEIAGTISPDLQRHVEFFQDSRVRVSGWLPRGELAKRMAAAEVFLFPSLAEGSARVVFEALAAGCYVITTPNAGSIVKDRIHGRLIASGSSQELEHAIREVVINRDDVAEIGCRNAKLIRSNYCQRDYGDKLTMLYAELMESQSSVKA